MTATDPESNPPKIDACDSEDFPPCPVRPLGHRERAYYFFSPSGELIEITAFQMTGPGLAMLFNGSDAWLRRVFPRYGRSGNVVGYCERPAADWLIRACVKAGLFDPMTPRRGLGVWRDGDGLVVHCGNHLLLYGPETGAKVLRAGQTRHGSHYVAAMPSDPVADAPAPTETGHDLRQLLRSWQWSRGALAADACLGWIGQALLGGAPRWRVHWFTTGQRGTGKTLLIELIRAALGDQAHPIANNVTEASLRQGMTGQARTILIDEAEHDGEGSRAGRVIELTRHMSSGDGARALRGSVDGRAQSFEVTGAVYMSAILHPPLRAQDRSRIITQSLDPFPIREPGALDVEELGRAIDRMRAQANALRRRAIEHWPQFLQALTTYRDGLMQLGADGRAADQVGTLLAGFNMLTEDSAPDSDSAHDQAMRWFDLVDMGLGADEDSEGTRCLNHLYSSTVDAWRGGDRTTVGILVARARLPDGDAHRKALRSIGLKLVRGSDPTEDTLCVSREHAQLHRIFAGTPWAGGVWTQALRFLPDTKATEHAVRFDGLRCRATELDAAWLPCRDDGTENS